MVGGTAVLFVYLLPEIEAIAVALGIVVSIWQGIILWRAETIESQVSEIGAGQPDHV